MVWPGKIWTIDAESVHTFEAFGEKKNPPVGTQHLLDESSKDNYVFISSQIQNLALRKHVDRKGNTTTYLRTTEKEFKIDDGLDDSEKQVLATKYLSNAIVPMYRSDPTLPAQQEICGLAGYFCKH
jgi:hypothetical protein